MASRTTDLNLTPETHRAPTSIWDREGWNGNPQPRALARWLLGIGGVALAAEGIRRRSAAGGVLAGLGGVIAWWALSGEGDLSEARARLVSMLDRRPWHADDVVQEASADSFPASDAPSWTPTVGSSPRK